jgi:nucleoside-diphosphate-sugar epimerase
MNVLITGASGFIGNYIASEMLQRLHTVACIVRKPDSISTQGVEKIIADLNDLDSLNDALQKKAFEVVIDGAAKIPLATDKNEDYFENIQMTRNLLKVLSKRPPEFFLKLSTIDVYRIHDKITENTEIYPQNYYSLSKRVSEQFVEIWGKDINIPTCILRLTQIFGTGDRSNKFIPSVIRQIKANSKIFIYGDGLDLRDYLFVEDAARLIADCCEKKVFGILNLASGKSHSLNEVVEALQKVSDKAIQVEFRNRKKTKLDYEFDISNLVNALGELRLTNLLTALRKTYYQER